MIVTTPAPRENEISASAWFHWSSGSPGDACAPLVFGACTVVAPCTVAGGSSTPFASAGTITITGGTTPIVLVPGAAFYSSTSTTLRQPVTAGQPMTIAAAGALVPAFTGTTVVPGTATITAPAEPSIIQRTLDIPLDWTDAGPGTVRVGIFELNSGSGLSSASVRCDFPASDDHGVVPAAALAKLSSGTADFSIETIDDVEVDAGAWAADLEAAVLAETPSGSLIGGPVTLQ